MFLAVEMIPSVKLKAGAIFFFLSAKSAAIPSQMVIPDIHICHASVSSSIFRYIIAIGREQRCFVKDVFNSLASSSGVLK